MFCVSKTASAALKERRLSWLCSGKTSQPMLCYTQNKGLSVHTQRDRSSLSVEVYNRRTGVDKCFPSELSMNNGQNAEVDIVFFSFSGKKVSHLMHLVDYGSICMNSTTTKLCAVSKKEKGNFFIFLYISIVPSQCTYNTLTNYNCTMVSWSCRGGISVQKEYKRKNHPIHNSLSRQLHFNRIENERP